MAIYLALAVIPALFGIGFPQINQNKRQKKCFYIVCGIVMLLVMGLRHYSLGSTDTTNYYNAMNRAIKSPSWENFYVPDYFEIGSQLFIFLLSRIFHDPQWLLIVTSFIYIISIFYFIDRNSDDIALSLVAYISLGLMTFNLQGMRQSLAMSICLFAYEQAKRKHLIRFILIVLFATAFHRTAIVFFPIYILVQLKYSKKKVMLLIACSALILPFSNYIVNFANQMFEREYKGTASSGGFVATAIYIVLLVISFMYYKNNLYVDNQMPLVYILTLGTLCYVMRYIGALAAERISFYFAFSQVALFPKVVNITLRKDRGKMYILIISFAIALYAYRLSGSDFVPYKFFWQQVR